MEIDIGIILASIAILISMSSLIRQVILERRQYNRTAQWIEEQRIDMVDIRPVSIKDIEKQRDRW